MKYYEDGKNLGQHVKAWSAKHANRPFLCQYDEKQDVLRKTTYGEVFADVLAWCDFYEAHGVKPGDRVVMISPKSLYHSRFFESCWYYGAITVPVCETFGDPEMQFVLKDCEPSLIIADASVAERVAKNVEGNVPVVLTSDMPKGEVKAPVTREPSTAAFDDVACLIYTSGSTGMPKGVMLTHRNILVNASSALEVYKIKMDARGISLLPYWHGYAMTLEQVALPLKGVECCVARDMRDFKRNLAKYNCTFMLVVPRIIEIFKQTLDRAIAAMPPKKKALFDRAIYNASRIFTARPSLNGGILRMVTHHLFYDPLVFRRVRKFFGSRLRFVVCGGAPLGLELQIFFKYLGIPLLQGYGLTETSPVVSSNLISDHLLGSIGKIFPWLTPERGGDYTFLAEDGTMGKDKHGALLLKGDCVMKGYWNHTDASAKSFVDGWLNTGDMAYEREGFLFIDGRKGNMIVLIGGEKLHPEHVEDAIKKGAKFISEAMVIGEKCKNVYVLANVPRDLRGKYGEEELHKLVKEEILKHTEHLAPCQRPKEVLILPDFTVEEGTLTATLKVRRFHVQKRFAAEIEAFLKSCGEEDATNHDVNIASSRVMESLEEVK